MTAKNGPIISHRRRRVPQLSLRRLVPLAVIAVISVGVVALGWHRQVSFETLVRHHEALQDFIATHEVSAVAAYVVLYIAAVALRSRSNFPHLIGGILFGGFLGVRRRWRARPSERFPSS